MREAAFTLQLDPACLAPVAGLYSRLTDLGPVMDKAGTLMLSSVAENFAAQGRPEKWSPLSLSTVRGKGQAVMLYETGFLMSSIGYAAFSDRLEVTARAPYAAFQQEGGHAGNNGAATPARPFLLFQHDDVGAIRDMVEKYIAGAD